MKKLYTFLTSNLFIVLLLFGILGYQYYLHQQLYKVYRVTVNAEESASDAGNKVNDVLLKVEELEQKLDELE